MRIYTSGASSYLEVLNPEIVVGTANTIQISSHSTGLVPGYESLSDRGRDWITVTLVEATTGVFRYTTTMENPSGRFFTNLGGLASEEAIRTLELTASENLALYRHRVRFPAGITIMVSRMTSSDTIQFFAPDTVGMLYLDSAQTEMSHGKS